MARNPVKRLWTVEEYLAYEQETGTKHEPFFAPQRSISEYSL